MRGGNIIGTPPVIIPPSLLLDLYPSTAGQYFMHKVSSTYTGACIRVRRSSDNAEQDIGFVGLDLDTAALTSFVGSGDGLVTTWYSQSGFFNLTQISSASQPAIVLGGALQTLNGKPCLKFDGLNDFLTGGTSANNVVDIDFFFTGISELVSNNRTFWAKSLFSGVENRIAHIRETSSYGLVQPRSPSSPVILSTGTDATAKMYSVSCFWNRVIGNPFEYRGWANNVNTSSNLTNLYGVQANSRRFLVGAYSGQGIQHGSQSGFRHRYSNAKGTSTTGSDKKGYINTKHTVWRECSRFECCQDGTGEESPVYQCGR
jgi:hypothetical protein